MSSRSAKASNCLYEKKLLGAGESVKRGGDGTSSGLNSLAVPSQGTLGVDA